MKLSVFLKWVVATVTLLSFSWAQAKTHHYSKGHKAAVEYMKAGHVAKKSNHKRNVASVKSKKKKVAKKGKKLKKKSAHPKKAKKVAKKKKAKKLHKKKRS